jgi:hypothetical protein
MPVFYDEELLTRGPTPKLEDHLDCIFSTSVDTPPYLEAVSSICNLRMRHAVVIRTHVTWNILINIRIICKVVV